MSQAITANFIKYKPLDLDKEQSEEKARRVVFPFQTVGRLDMKEKYKDGEPPDPLIRLFLVAGVILLFVTVFNQMISAVS